MRKLLLVLLVAFLIIPSLAAAPYSSFYVLPVAGRTAGAFGTMWISDVAIQNFQSSPMDVSFVFIASGEGDPNNVSLLVVPGTQGATKVTVPAGGSVLIKDVLSAIAPAGTNLTGAIMVGADKPFAMTSRAYNASTGVGQGVTPAPDFLDNTLGRTDNANAVAFVPGLISNAAFRSNLGFVAGTPNGTTPMAVSVTIRGADGTVLGTPRTFIVPPGALEHIQFGASAIASRTWDIAAAEFRIVSGSGAVVPYGSIIDNVTADGIFVLGTFPPNLASGKSALPSVFEDFFVRLTR